MRWSGPAPSHSLWTAGSERSSSAVVRRSFAATVDCGVPTPNVPGSGCRKDVVVDHGRSTAYLGPDRGRWGPTAWADATAAGGLLDESHWVDLKQQLPAGKAKHNT
jgi:hypothetical protein